MSVTGDIFYSYLRPRRVIARKLADGAREDRAIATLIGACVMLFISKLPAQARQAELSDTSMIQLLTYDVYAIFLLFPLILYGLSALTRIVVLPFSPRGGWFHARMALFWALLASAPLMIVNGVISGLAHSEAVRQASGLAWLVGFFWLWIPMFLQSQWGDAPS